MMMMKIHGVGLQYVFKNLKLEVITDQCSVFNLKLTVGIESGFFFTR